MWIVVFGRLMKIYSPIPSGVAGALENEKGSYGEKDLQKAKNLLAEAGYPGGIDPATGKNLVFTFDQAGGETFFRQTAEMLASPKLATIRVSTLPTRLKSSCSKNKGMTRRKISFVVKREYLLSSVRKRSFFPKELNNMKIIPSPLFRNDL